MAGRTHPPEDNILIGRIVGPHGIRGGVRVQVLTDFPERFEAGRDLFVGNEVRQIKKVMWHKDQVRLDLVGITTREQAEALKWVELSVPASDLPELDEDEFLVSDLMGLPVFEEDGTPLGPIRDILSTPAHEILVVGEILIPAVEAFITEIDLEKGRVYVRLIDGMKPGTGEEAAPEPRPKNGREKA